MRVNVDPAGCNNLTRGIYFARGITVDCADCGDQSIRDCDVAGKARRAGAIDDGAVADDQIIGGRRSARNSPARE